ncbi:helix-hairpin-helix domain-containing protein [Bacillus sp. mrc49]|uniref:helix-hairpin-helix domain-containing protein n=1 Tax=Bacillus sp. mrc49 TaxID=2054913 RepID=UPI000C272063|nr:helix-hairpin-helix domain-containing protein [Bacillus sp. mrc49]PJN89316.1 competence protein ComEA [Bacillus sp. mrc49]
MDRILKDKKTMIALAVAMGSVVIFLFWQHGYDHEPVEPDEIFAEAAKEGGMESETNVLDDHVILVDVKGAVENPGVFTAQAGDRINDLISAAGSFTDKADKDKVNLAQLVEDQMVIYVPEIGEEDKGNLEYNHLIPSGGMAEGQVNLNTATQQELETLTGIGPSKAAAILEYRESVGPFKQIDELKKVTGIGDKTFEKLQDSISVR